MASQTEKAKAKLSILASNLDDLETQLEPLFAQTLPESILGLEPIQQAKLQTVLPYLVYDLVFIYLKSRGIDPKTHPVVPELDRVRQYFEKITNSEKPPTKRTEVDKAAAGRFIKHAITQATYTKTQIDDTPTPSSSSAKVQAKITSKMLQRQEYERALKDGNGEESEDGGLEVFGDGGASMEVDAAVITNGSKGKGKEASPAIEGLTPQPSNKRRRPAVDPFAGYGDDAPVIPIVDRSASKRSKSSTDMTPNPDAATNLDPNPHQNKTSVNENDSFADSPSGTPKTDSSKNPPASESSDSKKAKKSKKKARKSLKAAS